jgi:hypothetical protein
MSERAAYSRVYWSIVDDPKFATIYDDDRHLAAWLRLLLIADQAHPASPTLPAGVRKASVTALADAGLISLGSAFRYRICGLDAERERRRLAATSRGRDGTRTGTGRSANGIQSGPLDETRQDEPRQDETDARAEHDPWADPEGEALVWLARHGCNVRPGDGYHRRLVTATEQYGVNAIIGMFDRLATAGTHSGDVKGFVFGAIDALDARHRPSLTAIAAEDRAGEREEDFKRRLARTRAATAEVRAVLENHK